MAVFTRVVSRDHHHAEHLRRRHPLHLSAQRPVVRENWRRVVSALELQLAVRHGTHFPHLSTNTWAGVCLLWSFSLLLATARTSFTHPTSPPLKPGTRSRLRP